MTDAQRVIAELVAALTPWVADAEHFFSCRLRTEDCVRCEEMGEPSTARMEQSRAALARAAALPAGTAEAGPASWGVPLSVVEEDGWRYLVDEQGTVMLQTKSRSIAEAACAALNQAPAPPGDGEVARLRAEIDTDRKRALDDCASALHPHWPPDGRNTYIPTQLPDMIRALIRERDAYSRAKSENDERFMLERDRLAAENAALSAELDDWRRAPWAPVDNTIATETRAATLRACAEQLHRLNRHPGITGYPIVDARNVDALAATWAPPAASGEGNAMPTREQSACKVCGAMVTVDNEHAHHPFAQCSPADAPAPAAGVPWEGKLRVTQIGEHWFLHDDTGRCVARLPDEEDARYIAALNRPTAPPGCGCRATIEAKAAELRRDWPPVPGAILHILDNLAAQLPVPGCGDADGK